MIWGITRAIKMGGLPVLKVGVDRIAWCRFAQNRDVAQEEPALDRKCVNVYQDGLE